MLHYTLYQSPIGEIAIVSKGGKLIWLNFTDIQQVPSGAQKDRRPELEQTVEWLDVYFSGKQPDLLPPMLRNRSAFAETVSDIMLEIPMGGTTTYGAIAREAAARLGREHMSAQAVGGAVGRNPFPLIIPCHRVIGSDGSLTGYGCGLERKQWLLRHENAIL